MKIAVEGCAHGELEKIYEAIGHLEREEGIKVDLLVCCGDFQATRNIQDLHCMAVPPKFQDMCSFYKYYSEEKVAPVLTLFIGGNHEASNHLAELYYGGWVAPRIYYLGCAGVVEVARVKIGGLSGIYKGHDYMKGHFEAPPYTAATKRSVYHVRNLEVFRLKQMHQPIDIMLSHDWPRGIYDYGDKDQLLRFKPFFKEDIEANKLGSKPCEDLLTCLKPTYWFAAHLHCKFAAIVPHKADEDSKESKITKFLALDKCLPKRKFLQVVDVPHDESQPIELHYSLEWLSILHLTNHLLSIKKSIQYMPGPMSQERWVFTPTAEEQSFVLKRMDGDLRIPHNFDRTAVAYSPHRRDGGGKEEGVGGVLSPQTTLLCSRLGVDDPAALLRNYSAVPGRDSSLASTTPSFLTPERPGEMTTVSLTETESGCLSLNSSQEDSLSKCSSSSRGPRLSLSLPAPKRPSTGECGDAELEESERRFQRPTSEKLSAKVIFGETESETSNPVDPETPMLVKKFKRRNLALYDDPDCD